MLLLVLLAPACSTLVGADFDRTLAGQDAGADGDPATGADGGGATPEAQSDDQASPARDGGDAPSGSETFAEAAARLSALRVPGPRTAQGSNLACTPSGIAWRDEDGAMHAWRSDTQKQIDYTFKQAPPRRDIVASDHFVAVSNGAGGDLMVYDATQPGVLLTSLPYAMEYGADETGIIRIDLAGNDAALDGLKVRRWIQSTGKVEDVSAVLPTTAHEVWFGQGKVVLPTNVYIPYPLYVVDLASSTTTSVTFDGATMLNAAIPTARGLIVAYSRTAGLAIRLYEAYDDARRGEIGDELNNIPPRLRGAPPKEHVFMGQIAADGDNIVYSSPYGIWGYGVVTGALTPLQLGDGQVYVIDAMCVAAATRELFYRVSGDVNGQIWRVPLAGLLP